MAIVTRYFSTTGAGAANGTTWADRAALFSSGNWSTVITGFAFNASDSLEARIQGGLTYTCSQSLASGLFANPPSVSNLLVLHGCNSSGDLLLPPDGAWVSSQPAFSTATLPVIATTTNIITFNLANLYARLIGLTASGAGVASITASGNFDWINIICTSNSASATGFLTPTMLLNSCVLFSGTGFEAGIVSPSGLVNNVRIDGTAATSSGTRRGANTTSSGHVFSRITSIGCAGGGAFMATGSATRSGHYSRSLMINCGAFGFQGSPTASQTVFHTVANSVIVNCVTGIDGNTNARFILAGNRLRDNSSANYATTGNSLTSVDDTSSGTNANEFVDAASGDYRIKLGSAIWGKGIGPGDQPASSGGLMLPRPMNGGYSA